MYSVPPFILYYDKDCPLCVAYTTVFMKYGLLHESGRVSYTDAIASGSYPFDKSIAKDRIALYNTESKEIFYGIDSMLEVLGHRFAWIKTIGKLPPIYWFLNKLYSFISYNRKIIAPVTMCASKENCIPSKSWFWRIVFIIFCATMCTIIDSSFFAQPPFNSYYILSLPFIGLLFFAVQLLFQGICCVGLKERNIYDYIGQLSFSSLVSSLLLIPVISILKIIQHTGIQQPQISVVLWALVSLFVFFFHRKRVLHSGFNMYLVYTWVLLRILLYPIIFNFKL